VRDRAWVPRASAGQDLTYTITVTNPTLVAIRNVAVCEAFPGGLLYVRSSASANVDTGTLLDDP
jgi:uncharacterized repeat protein (TIGR01451 family)